MSHNLTQLFQQKVVPGLTKQFFQASTTGWMDNNAIGVEYRGGKYIIMHEMDVSGLGNYDRMLGYPSGNITGGKKQYELTMDRGREFLIDEADNDETGFIVNAAQVMSLFQRKYVIPEVDSYRYSKIFSEVNTKASSNVLDDAISASGITDQLADDITQLRDVVGDIPLAIIMPGTTQKFFGRDFTRSLDVISWLSGEIRTKAKGLDGDPFMIVPSARMKSAYDFADGVSEGQREGGFAPASGAKDMKWIITPVTAPIAVAKIDKMRAFTPEEYQKADAWKVDYRLYHDLWMTQESCDATIIRTGAIS